MDREDWLVTEDLTFWLQLLSQKKEEILASSDKSNFARSRTAFDCLLFDFHKRLSRSQRKQLDDNPDAETLKLATIRFLNELLMLRQAEKGMYLGKKLQSPLLAEVEELGSKVVGMLEVLNKPVSKFLPGGIVAAIVCLRNELLPKGPPIGVFIFEACEQVLRHRIQTLTMYADEALGHVPGWPGGYEKMKPVASQIFERLLSSCGCWKRKSDENGVARGKGKTDRIERCMRDHALHQFVKSHWQEKSFDKFLQRALLGSFSSILKVRKDENGVQSHVLRLKGFPEGMLFYLINRHPNLPNLELRLTILKFRLEGSIAYISKDEISRRMWVIAEVPEPIGFQKCASKKLPGCQQGFFAAEKRQKSIKVVKLTRCPICDGRLSQRLTKAVPYIATDGPKSTVDYSGKEICSNDGDFKDG